MKTPAADRKILVLLAGVVWSAVGMILCITGICWLMDTQGAFLLLGIGVICGIAAHHYGFSRLAETNLIRIFAQAPGRDKVCVFAFQNTRSYVIVAVMMLLGFTLRHLPIPKNILSPVYLTIGIGLFLSSLKYYFHFGRLLS